MEQLLGYAMVLTVPQALWRSFSLKQVVNAAEPIGTSPVPTTTPMGFTKPRLLIRAKSMGASAKITKSVFVGSCTYH